VDPPAGHTASFNNLYSSIPFVLSMAGGKAHGLFFDNTHRVELDLALEDEGRAYFGAEGGDVVYYVFCGPTPAGVLDRYTELTGRIPMPPLWSLATSSAATPTWTRRRSGTWRATSGSGTSRAT
jgi:alpha-glucosidase